MKFKIIFLTLVFLSLISASCADSPEESVATPDNSTVPDQDNGVVVQYPCDPNPCIDKNKSICISDNGHALCQCDSGFQDDGNSNCIEKETNPCYPNPCKESHKTVCTNNSGTAVCSCDKMFEDDGNGNCIQDRESPCDPNPCSEPHKTVCDTVNGDAVCSCDQHYEDNGNGICVQKEIDPCDPNPCSEEHKTVCKDNDGISVCSCDSGYEKDDNGACKEIVDPCDPNPCSETNKTICTDVDGSSVCSCDENYEDDGNGTCIEIVDPCSPSPCSEEHKTVCSDNEGSAVCSCDAGYSGDGNGVCVEDISAGDLLISEYVEGLQENKALEVYNGTGADIDLANYQFLKAVNGAEWNLSRLSMSGTLVHGKTYVVANANSAPEVLAVADATSSFMNFNGDDAIALVKKKEGDSYEIIDIIGVEKTDPGNGWGVAGTDNGTQNNTLIRKATIQSGQTDWAISAGTSKEDSEWHVAPENYFDNLGKASSEYNPAK